MGKIEYLDDHESKIERLAQLKIVKDLVKENQHFQIGFFEIFFWSTWKLPDVLDAKKSAVSYLAMKDLHVQGKSTRKYT